MNDEVTTSQQAEQRSSNDRRAMVVGIAAGIISSAIFAIILQPTIAFAAHKLSNIGTNITSHHIDVLYQESIVASQSSVIYHIYSMMQQLFFLLIFGMIVFIYEYGNYTKRLIAISKGEVPKRSFFSSLGWKDPAKVISLAQVVAAALLVLSVGLMADEIFGAYVKVQARASYDRRMMALAPYATQVELDALTGQWARIDSRSGYEATMTSMDAVARTHGAKLPPPFI